jgi:peptide/nickel transport system permease protein
MLRRRQLDPEQVKKDLLESREGLGAESESLGAIYWRRFKKHSLGKIGLVLLLLLYGLAVFADFVSPFSMEWTDKKKSYHPPTGINWIYKDEDGNRSFRPYVFEKYITNIAFKRYGIVPAHTIRAISIEKIPNTIEMRSVAVQDNPASRKSQIINDVGDYFRLSDDHFKLQELAEEIDRIEKDPKKDVTYRFKIGEKKYKGETITQEIFLVKGNKNFVRFFNEGIPYTFLGLFRARTHLFGSPTGGYFIFGADQLGRDLLSRLLHGSRISLSVGLIGAFITFFLGLIIGGIAGFFGGKVDTVIMRIVEIVLSFPSLYLLFALRATFPPSLTSIQVYLLIVVILSVIGWASLARIIRGLVLAIKNEDYVMSARTMGLSNWKIIRKHILPNTLSFVIIQATISIPRYILGETSLSLLGLGITEPQSSWGNMLSVARNYRVVKDFPWILIPGVAIFLAIMAWNFFGDGIRDAVDPKSKH